MMNEKMMMTTNAAMAGASPIVKKAMAPTRVAVRTPARATATFRPVRLRRAGARYL